MATFALQCTVEDWWQRSYGSQIQSTYSLTLYRKSLPFLALYYSCHLFSLHLLTKVQEIIIFFVSVSHLYFKEIKMKNRLFHLLDRYYFQFSSFLLEDLSVDLVLFSFSTEKFIISCSEALLTGSFLNFILFEIVFIYPYSWKDIFMRYRIGKSFFFFHHFKNVSMASDEKLAVTHITGPLYVMCCLPLTAFSFCLLLNVWLWRAQLGFSS